MDADPPRFEARRATSWLVLFMTHIASCGAGAVRARNEANGHLKAHCPEDSVK